MNLQLKDLLKALIITCLAIVIVLLLWILIEDYGVLLIGVSMLVLSFIWSIKWYLIVAILIYKYWSTVKDLQIENEKLKEEIESLQEKWPV